MMDGAAHRHRKRMFLTFLADETHLSSLRAAFRKEWLKAAAGWELRREVRFFDEVNLVLTRTAVSWAGIPDEFERPIQLCRALADMVANAGNIGPKAWLALLRRSKVERQLRSFVQALRAETYSADGSPAHVVVTHRDLDRRLLTEEVAAVEILNILRPTLAIGRYLVFCALALERHPDLRRAIASGDESLLRPFVEEVRRVYPFFPFIGGRARQAFHWRDYVIPAGSWVLLDLFGTNRDPRRYEAPEAFRPGQAPNWETLDFGFVPQGGGDPGVTHRCPGEAATVVLMMEATRLLCRSISYDVPPQDLNINLRRIPTAPRSGMVLCNVRLLI
ncbi:MAG: cytochrome P450 [Pseudomonadota bacterium]